MSMDKEIKEMTQDHHTAELSDEELQTIFGGTACSYPDYDHDLGNQAHHQDNERYGYGHHDYYGYGYGHRFFRNYWRKHHGYGAW